jgi:hypothetical protein
MKCIKAIRSFGKSKTGDVVRVDDTTAFERVLEGSWIYTSKMEWKTGSKTVKEPEVVVQEPTTNEEQPKPKRPKFKKGKQQ